MTIKHWLRGSALTVLSLCSGLAFAAAPSLEPPSPDKIEEARKIIDSMRANLRGPYSNIQWVCKDGTVLPPKSGACASHGGGHQYAKYSAQRDRLAALGYPVGTIFMAFDRPAQAADARPFQRLRDLPLEQYMVDIDDGWVLRGARSYRGRVQMEDEEQAGRNILLAALADPQRSPSDLLLMRELVKTIPHAGAGQDPTRDVRRLSQELAERDSRFEALRAEIHGKPGTSTARRVRDWQERYKPVGANAETLASVIAELDKLYGLNSRDQRLSALSAMLKKADPSLSAAVLAPHGDALEHAAELMAQLRRSFDGTTDSAKQLTYLDAMTILETEIITAARGLPVPDSRFEGLRRANLLAQAASDLGWLSPTEGARLALPLERMLEKEIEDAIAAQPKTYSNAIKQLQLAPAWAQTMTRFTFAESLVKYTALDKRSAHYVDDLLRGSVMQPLAEITEVLARDDAALSGVEARIMGESISALALNPGQAIGRLRVLELGDDGELPAYAPSDIIVIPNTTSELFPAAGIITVGEGNPLSHIQILARNLGIPNIVVDAAISAKLAAFDGQAVELAAAQDGRILMRLAPKLPDGSAKPAAPTQISRTGTVAAPIPDLTKTDPIVLSELRAKLSGIVVGPKAANVGELAYLFPDRVAPAVALPFGAFAAHTEAGPNAPRLRLKDAFAKFDRGDITEDAFLSVLDDVKKQTAALTLQPETRRKLEAAIDATIKPGAGFFIRSDTNMEDLPQFTGAGLNLTLPNVTGRDKQFAGISEVWASVYTRRAMAWRSQILSNPDDVFSSVLMMQSVPSEKSGVMVTTDLTGAQTKKALTVSVAWGVGGAVDNESAASYLLTPTQSILLSDAKAPYQRYLKSAGGVGWKPAQSGPVLTAEETAELRQLAKEVLERYPPSLDGDLKPLPFDIEFGFAEGKLNLLQIRPLVQRGAVAAEAIVSAEIAKPGARKPVRLDLPLIGVTLPAQVKTGITLPALVPAAPNSNPPQRDKDYDEDYDE